MIDVRPNTAGVYLGFDSFVLRYNLHVYTLNIRPYTYVYDLLEGGVVVYFFVSQCDGHLVA